MLGNFTGSLFPIDLTTGKLLRKLKVGGLPHGLHLEGDALWVNSMAGVFQMDVRQIWGDGSGAMPSGPEKS